MWSYWFEEGIICFAGLLEQEEQEEDYYDEIDVLKLEEFIRPCI